VSRQDASPDTTSGSWYSYLRRGFARSVLADRVAGESAPKASFAKLGHLAPFIRKHLGQGIIGASLVLLTSLLTLPQPLITRYLVDDVLLARQLGLFAGAVALLAIIKLASLLSGLLQGFYFTRFEQVVVLDIQEALLTRLLRLPLSFFTSKETGYLMARISSDVQGVRFFFSSVLVQVVTLILRLIGGVAMLLYLQWQLALLAILVAPVIVVTARLFAQRIRLLSQHSMERSAEVSSRLQETLAAPLLVKSFATEEREVSRVMRRFRRVLGISLEQNVVGSLARLTMSSLGDIVRLLVLVAGGYLVIIDQFSLGSLLAFQTYLGYVFGPAQSLAGINLQMHSALVALDRVSALFEIAPESSPGSGTQASSLAGRIELRDLSFAYPGSEPVLSHVSAVIEPGQHVAVVGRSGVGKTTLACLILRLYQPTSGEILFDEISADAYELASLRQRIGFVSQQSLLLSGSILDTLRYGNEDASMAAVVEAARVARIHSFVTSLPDAYHSRVGERGVNLSEGQKQRLALARALVKKPDILVLDEPSSALDDETERSIVAALPRVVRDKTLVTITHRPSTLEAVDTVWLLEDRHVSVLSPKQALARVLSHRYPTGQYPGPPAPV